MEAIVGANPHAEQENVVPIDLIHPGDLIEIRSGELIPADGRIVEGTGALNKAPLTGESVPVDVGVGDTIEAGLVLAQGPVVCEVLAVGDNTRLSGLIDAVHTFREVPPRLHSGIEKFTAIWVPLVLFGAFAVWYLPSRMTGKSSFFCGSFLVRAPLVGHARSARRRPLQRRTERCSCSGRRRSGTDGTRQSHPARQDRDADLGQTENRKTWFSEKAVA